MTDNNAPERIWAKSQEWPKGTGRIEVYATSKDDPDDPGTEYVRADLVHAQIEQDKMHHAQAFSAGVEHGDAHSPEVLALVTAAREMFDGGSRAAWNSLSAALAAFQEVK